VVATVVVPELWGVCGAAAVATGGCVGTLMGGGDGEASRDAVQPPATVTVMSTAANVAHRRRIGSFRRLIGGAYVRRMAADTSSRASFSVVRANVSH
jgi:hypothetical protein